MKKQYFCVLTIFFQTIAQKGYYRLTSPMTKKPEDCDLWFEEKVLEFEEFVRAKYPDSKITWDGAIREVY